MKYKEYEIKNYLNNPDPNIKACLIFGTDRGSVLENYGKISKLKASDLSDPFSVSDLSTDDIKEEPSKLIDEAKSISFMNNGKLIRVKDVNDSIAETVTDTLSALNNSQNFLLITSDNLKPTSKLRKLFEISKSAIALACYSDDNRNITSIIKEMVQKENVIIDQDALNYLVQNLGEDRFMTRSEVEKLITYVGDEKHITLNDVKVSIYDSSPLSMTDLSLYLASGNVKKSLETFDRLIMEGINPIPIIRVLIKHFKTLYEARAKIEAKQETPESAVKKIRPPVFFKNLPQVKYQLENLSTKKIKSILDKLTGTEIACKTTGAPMEEILSFNVLRLSSFLS
jgi:DNA polymerase-3 subunit delta